MNRLYDRMTRLAPNKTPAWTGRSVPLLSEEGFAEALERLEAKIVALEALAKTPPKGAAALGDLVRMADEARFTRRMPRDGTS